jgi:hypothetical protein
MTIKEVAAFVQMSDLQSPWCLILPAAARTA